ncbi:MAG: hypothetical protein ACREDQ_13990, partial [Limisphaerales bacterium]
MKKIVKLLSFAVLACALPLAVNAQMGNMAHETMNMTNSPQMGMASDSMNSTPKMGGMSSGGMNSANPQMGNMAPAMNGSKMDNMGS